VDVVKYVNQLGHGAKFGFGILDKIETSLSNVMKPSERLGALLMSHGVGMVMRSNRGQAIGVLTIVITEWFLLNRVGVELDGMLIDTLESKRRAE
jgi:hypothetical protein